MHEQTSWDFFFSYSRHSNLTLVTEIINTLEIYGLSIWYDKFDVIFGSDIYDNISNIIVAKRITKGMILFLDKTFFKKEWCLIELQYALERNIPLLPILYNIKKEDLPNKYDFIKKLNVSTISKDIEYTVDKILYFYIINLQESTISQDIIKLVKNNNVIQSLIIDFSSSYNKNNVILCDNLCTGIKIIMDANSYIPSKELTALYKIVHLSAKKFYNGNISDFRKKIVLYATTKFIKSFFTINF